MIFNLSLQTSVIPDIWKVASVTPVPVFKKGSPSDPSNYRPISLTCIACKLLECGVKDAVLDHLKNCNVISNSQHGFLSERSTTCQLLECSLDWRMSLSCKNAVNVV